jgi:hypothetical protein
MQSTTAHILHCCLLLLLLLPLPLVLPPPLPLLLLLLPLLLLLLELILSSASLHDHIVTVQQQIKYPGKHLSFPYTMKLYLLFLTPSLAHHDRD